MRYLLQLKSSIRSIKFCSIVVNRCPAAQRALFHLESSPKLKDIDPKSSQKDLTKLEPTNKNENNTNEKSKNNGSYNKERSPLQRLLRVKDYADWIFFIFFATGVYIWYKRRKESQEIEKKFELEWLKIPDFNHKFFVCQGFYLPEFMARHLNSFKAFKPRKDDVWIISFPKSGTTWVQELVYLMANKLDYEKAKKSSIEDRSPFFEYPTPGLKEIEKMASPRIIKSHLPLEFLPENLDNESKIIYIVRNPKDVSASYYHFAKLSTQANYSGSFNDFAKLFIDGTIPYGPWWKHVDNYTSRKNVHIIHYEDLHEKPVEEIRRLSEFLGVKLSDAEVKSLIDWCSFENMEKNPSVNYEWYKTMGIFKKDGKFFRKGKIGDWLNYYSRKDSLALDDKVREKLAYKHPFNYGISDEDLKKIYSS